MSGRDQDYRNFRIVERDAYQGVPYIVIERWWDIPDMDVTRLVGFHDYYCGYVKMTNCSITAQEGDVIDGIEITYGPDSGWWIGFDTAHVWMNDMTEKRAINMTKRLAKALDPREVANEFQ